MGDFDGLGAEAEALMVLDSEGADDTGLVSRIGWADVIYLTGGDPPPAKSFLTTRGPAGGAARLARMLEAVKRAVREGAVLVGFERSGRWCWAGGCRYLNITLSTPAGRWRSAGATLPSELRMDDQASQ